MYPSLDRFGKKNDRNGQKKNKGTRIPPLIK